MRPGQGGTENKMRIDFKARQTVAGAEYKQQCLDLEGWEVGRVGRAEGPKEGRAEDQAPRSPVRMAVSPRTIPCVSTTTRCVPDCLRGAHTVQG